MRRSLSTVLILGAMALLCAAPAQAATASFTTSTTTVQAGGSITFTSNSTEDPLGGPILSYEWSFGGSGAEVTQAFNTPGTYDVTLTVTDLLGSDVSDPTTITVTPPPPPTVSFTRSPAAPTAVLIGEPVTFTPSSAPGSGATIESSRWTFDDGLFTDVIGPPTTLSHSYTARGNYTVGLSVTDNYGQTDAASRNVRVHAAPVADFDVSPAAPKVGQEVLLTSRSSDEDGPLEAQNWDLDGDGEYDDASGAQVRGAFTSAGPHQVSLRVRDSDNVRAVHSKVVDVKKSEWLAPIPSSGPVNDSATPPASVTAEPFLRLLAPFPVVRLAGWRLMGGARIEILGVRAPRKSRVLVRCRGKRCPVKRMTQAIAARKKPKPVRLKRFERFFPAGAVIEVFVRRDDRLGKYTRFTIRPNRKRWKRLDGCVAPNTTRAVTCPAE